MVTGIFLEQLFAQAVVAGLHDFGKVLDHALADAGQFFELFRRCDEHCHRVGQGFDQFRGFLVAAVAADDGAINFEQLRGFAEYAGNLFVVHFAIISSV